MRDWLSDTVVRLGMDSPEAYLNGLKVRRQTVLTDCELNDSWTDEAEALRDDWQDMNYTLGIENAGKHNAMPIFDPANNVEFQNAVRANLALLEAAE